MNLLCLLLGHDETYTEKKYDVWGALYYQAKKCSRCKRTRVLVNEPTVPRRALQ